jgi:hypothetical protein
LAVSSKVSHKYARLSSDASVSFATCPFLCLWLFSRKEAIAAVYFIILVILWLSRKPGEMPGWGYLVNNYASDTLPPILIFFLAQCTPVSFSHPGKKFILAIFN